MLADVTIMQKRTLDVRDMALKLESLIAPYLNPLSPGIYRADRVEPIWQDPLVIAMPIRHELLAHKEIPLHKLGEHPLILCDPQVCEGYCRELTRLLRPLEREPNIVEHASSLDMMLTLVGAGYGIGFTTAARMATSQRTDVVARPLAVDSAVINTYLLRPSNDTLSPSLERFIARLRSQGGSAASKRGQRARWTSHGFQ